MIVSVVLPAFNEAENLTPLIEQIDGVLKTIDPRCNIIVVNDGSTDATPVELQALQKRFPSLDVVTHPVNRGFAAALKSGIARACERGGDAAIFLDSDLSHRPSDMRAMVEALSAGADVVLGSRFMTGGGMVNVPWWRVVISDAGNRFGRLALGVPFRDLTTGYRAIRRNVLEAIHLGEDGFTIQLEAVIRAHASGYRVVEVPILLGTRHHGESHMTYSAELFRNYWRLLRSCRRWMSESRR